jgi:excisionase family DNA binding protein
MTEGENFLTIKELAYKVNYTERQIRQFCKDGKIKAQKLTTGSRKWLIPKSELNKFGGEAKPTPQVSRTSQANWIEEYEAEHGELPLIPECMLPVVMDKTAKRVSKNMELSIPSLQWWNGLLPNGREQVLQTVDWLSKHKTDWWCKSREDYQAKINQSIAGRPSDIRLQWKR